MKDPFAFRRKFEPKIIELTKQADKFSREYIETNDYSALNKYRYYVNEIIKLIHDEKKFVNLNFKNIFCVGRRTKKLIEQKIGPVSHVEKNVQKLAEHLSRKLKKGQVTYFCSDLRLDTLPDVLSKNGIHVIEVIAYKTMHSPELISNDIVGVMFYSPSTVDSYLKENSTDKVAFCLGESTAKQARKYFKKVEVAKVPTVESLIELVNLHYV